MVIELPNIFMPDKMCEDCPIDKQLRNAFKSHIHKRATELLHLYILMCVDLLKYLFYLKTKSFHL